MFQGQPAGAAAAVGVPRARWGLWLALGAVTQVWMIDALEVDTFAASD